MPARKLTALFPASIAAAMTGCGAGGSGGEPPPAVAVTGAQLLPAYTFTLSDTGTEADRLGATTDFGAGTPVEIVIDSRIEPTIGRYDYATRTVTFTQGAVAVESDFGFIVVDILGPVMLAPGDAPGDVTIDLEISIEGSVSLDFGDGTVDLRRGSAPVLTLTVGEFEDLLANRLGVPVWQHQSALAWAALDLLRHLIVATADVFAQIDASLESAVSVDTSCALLPAAPPPGTVNQGLRRLTWLGSGSIRTGDDFAASYMDCWQPGAGGRGVLLDGPVRYGGLVATVSGGNLSRVGFQTVGGTLGGVLPDGLVVAATRSPSATDLELPPHLHFNLAHGVRLTFEAP